MSLKESTPLPELMMAAVKHLLRFKESIINISCADAILKLTDAIMSCSGVDFGGPSVDEVRASLRKLSKAMLSVEWRNPQVCI